MAMARGTHLLHLTILIQLYSLATSTSHAHGYGNTTAAFFCHPGHAAALLQVKQSFIFDYSSTALPSWQPRTDCCLWEGVGCDDVVPGQGLVTALDLGGRGLYSYGFHVALFNLTSLRYLDLSMNNFGSIPTIGFDRLSKLTHLNLSHSGLYGQIPISIAKIMSLVTLDLSSQPNTYDSYEDPSHLALFGSHNDLLLQEPSFETLIANLTNLRELYLDAVDISTSGEEWCSGLGEAVPRLQILSMAWCGLGGPIHTSLSSLRSLTVINLEYNFGISGVVPEFFADFLNLSVLQLSSNTLSGRFPRAIFQLKKLRVLDVSWNDQLSGQLPEFHNGASFETLNLQYTNFSAMNLSSFGNLMFLRELSFDGRSISMEPTDLLMNKFNSLQTLKLSFKEFFGELGPLFSWIINLKNLTSLALQGYPSYNILPPLIGNLTSLTSLEIVECEFLGQIPPSIGNLNKLTFLKISDCAFSGSMPSSIGNLKELRSLEMSAIGLSGPITPHIGHLNKLMILTLSECGFSGRIPSTIVNLTRLIYVDLFGNNLGGDIPTCLFTSPEMLWVELSSNQLVGPIHEFDTLSPHMKVISMGDNRIGGHVRASFFELTSLVILDLSSNNFTGLVKLSSFQKLRMLFYLDLSHNKFSVMEGEGSKQIVPLLPRLMILGLASCNMRIIPRFLMHLDHIKILDLSSNKIYGTVPKWIWETGDNSLASVNLSHNMFTFMQFTSYVLPNSRLRSLDISYNKLQGQIPMPNLLTTHSDSPQVLDYSNNRFSALMSNFTAYISQTAYLKLSKNNISGHIPYSICELRNLEVLDLSYNNFSGMIPSCLIEDSNLRVLNLRENNFEGTLPYNISEYCNLQTIDLHGNNIRGQLPRSLANCAELEVLDIGNNKIVDTFPSWLGSIFQLSVIVLRSNQFYGSLPYHPRDSISKEYFSNLQIIDIASNNFSGNLDRRWFERLTSMMAKVSNAENILVHLVSYSASYYQDIVAITYKGRYITFEKVLTSLTAIDFSNNALDGEIPESIGRLVSLHILNMSHNTFMGRIPPQIGEMRQLESLDLSWNELDGEIPEELTYLTFLSALNLRENNLEGRIPQSRQFATFDNTSYEGNAGLCGPPLSKPCGSSSNPNEAQVSMYGDPVDIIFCVFAGVGFGVGFTASILMKWGYNRQIVLDFVNMF